MHFKTLPENSGGYGLFNNAGNVLKRSFQPLRYFPVGPIEEVSLELQKEMSDLSVMRGNYEQVEVVVLGPFRFANHYSLPKTKFF